MTGLGYGNFDAPSARGSRWSEGGGDVFDLLARPAWHRQAACRGSNPELFFPGRGEDASYAKDICAGCPVTAECLEAGMGEIHGIWGGEAQRGRKRLRRLRRAA